MREILFRGKLKANGEWFYGCLKINLDKSTAIITPDDTPLGKYGIVDPDTVGECTGLTDKNGVKIFEGDILQHDSGTVHEVVFETQNGHAYFGWRRDELETWGFDTVFLRQLKVIGNIHDNQELMEETP